MGVGPGSMNCVMVTLAKHGSLGIVVGQYTHTNKSFCVHTYDVLNHTLIQLTINGCSV